MIKIKIDELNNHLWQWDLNRRIEIIGAPAGTNIHFSHEKDDNANALVTVSYEDSGNVYAPIPNILLQYPGKLFIYPYIENNEAQYTAMKYQVSIVKREKPDDYVYTETEVYSYKKIEEKLIKLEDNYKNIIKEEVDSIVPEWAREPEKPKYTAADVGALPDSTKIPTTLPNPYAINFEGATTSQYDGSKSVTIGIPSPDWIQDDPTSLGYIKNKPRISTDLEVIDLLIEEDMLLAITDSDGSILSDENENILLW